MSAYAVPKEKNTCMYLGDSLEKELGVSPLFARILVKRGITDMLSAREFLFGGLSLCHDPFLMKDMEKAVDRIRVAASRGEKITIFGDYDVDGITSSAILSEVLGHMGLQHDIMLPERLKSGYGLSVEAVKEACDTGTGLIITVDCGIGSVKEIDAANAMGMDVIVTDHHEIRGGELPKAYAVVDPHREDCEYPYKGLAGAGIAYKLARGLMRECPDIADDHLDLVALGTIADVAPLTGENRILSRIGLEKLRITSRPGIRALVEVAGLEQRDLTCRNIAFGIAPRVNAAGRTGSPLTALEIFTTKDRRRALEIASILDAENRNRQSIERDIVKSAMARARAEIHPEKDKFIILADGSWHPGVIGIVASRIAEEFLKPTILISLDGDEGKGSGRTTGDIDIFTAVNEAGEFLEGFGGHNSACGIKIKKEMVEKFREKMNNSEYHRTPTLETSEGEVVYDIETDLSSLSFRLISEISLLMPFGCGNPEPAFLTRRLKVKTFPRDIGRGGMKFIVTDGRLSCEAITFRKNSMSRPKRGDEIDLIYSPSINSYGGVDSLQLNIRSIDIIRK